MKNINSANNKYTVRDFSDAFKELKEDRDLSYNQLSIKSGLSAPYLFDLVNKKKLPPKSKNIKKIAKALKVEPEYFYEFRLRKLINILDSNRKYLDPVLKELYGQEKKIYTHTAKSRIAKARETRI